MGSGKSTTFKILTTQFVPLRGEAYVAGYSVRKQSSQVRAAMGVTFQSPSLDPLLSVEENLHIHASLYGLALKEAQSRIETYLHNFGIADRKNFRVSQLSGGLARRVELAKAMLNEPRVLLLDEPTANLDAQARLDFWALLETLRLQGTCIVVSTHLIEEAERCQHLVFVSEGTVVSSGSTASYLSQQAADAVELLSFDRAALVAELKEKFSLLDRQIVLLGEDRVVLKQDYDFGFLMQFCRSHPQLVKRVQWGQTSLADVYMQKTGKELL